LKGIIIFEKFDACLNSKTKKRTFLSKIYEKCNISYFIYKENKYLKYLNTI